MAKISRSQKKSFTTLVVLALVYSAFEYASTGAVSWPQKLIARATDQIKEYPQREEAGWRQAADKVSELGEAREGNGAQFDLRGKVVRVADGDTISVLDRQGAQHKIRMFGIDSPERDQPHGNAAGQALARLVDGQRVSVIIVEKDDYGRNVGTVFLGDTNINEVMVAGGHAWWYRYHAPHERHLEVAEQDARKGRRGLWSAQRPTPPWDWRRGRR